MESPANGSENGKNVLSLHEVEFSYPGGKEHSPVLQKISLSVTRGEFLCVLGPSGCGKSTLLRLAAGLLKPVSGKIEADGRAVEGPDWHRGVIFQAPTLYAWLNVQDNVAFGLKMRKFPKNEIRELTSRYIRLVGLEGYEHYKPYELSGGMKQRVALARSLVNQPEILLMDEPFGALDALTRKNMQALIRTIWAETKNTVLMITHDVDEALALATRAVVMSGKPGRILTSCRPNFGERLFGKEGEKVRYDPNYMEMREKILEVIFTQDGTRGCP